MPFLDLAYSISRKKLSHQGPRQSPRFVDLIAHDVCRCLLGLLLSREAAELLRDSDAPVSPNWQLAL